LSPGSELWGGDGMSTKLFSIPEYIYSYLTNFKCLIENGAFTSEKLLAKVEALSSAIASYVQRNEDKWFPLQRVKNRPFATEVQDIRNFINSRTTNFLNQIKSKLTNVQNVNEDKVLGVNGTTYFQCGVAPFIQKPKKAKSQDTTDVVQQQEVLQQAVQDSLQQEVQLEELLQPFTEVICQATTQSITCSYGFIQILSAYWGRTDLVTCQAPNMGSTNCLADVTVTVGNMCNGNSLCTLNGNNDYFTNPCPGVHKYLGVSYQCIGVQAHADSETMAHEEVKVSKLTSPTVITVLAVTAIVVILVFVVAVYSISVWFKKQQLQQESQP